MRKKLLSLKTFFLKEVDGQTFYTPPMEFIKKSMHGKIYRSTMKGHAKIWVSNKDSRVRYIEGNNTVYGSRMELLGEL